MIADSREILEPSVDARFDDEVRFLSELVKMPSDNPPGDCAPHAELAARLLAELGFEVEWHPVDEAACRDSGMLSVVNLVVRNRFGSGPVIALNAHGDVVGPGDGWSVDPYGAEIRDGCLYGRGAAVSKSDFATYAFALLALRALHARAGGLRGTVELHFTYDEEVGGSLGPRWLLARGISQPDLAIAAGFSYGVVDAHNGCLHLEVTVQGKSAHAAQPDSGNDALEAATGILTALYQHRRDLAGRRSSARGIGSPTLTVGTIQGGINTNVVPDRVSLRIDRRLIPEENAEEVEAGLRTLIAGAALGGDGIAVEVNRILLARPLLPVPGVERLSAPLARNASEVFGTDVPCHGVPLYTDARHYAETGIPTVLYGAGPRTITEANAHRADERVILADLRKATLTVALALAEILSTTASTPRLPC